MIRLENFNAGSKITTSALRKWTEVMRELQSVGINEIQPPLQINNGVLSIVLPSRVMIINESGDVLPAFRILGIDGVVYGSSDENAFKRQMALRGVTPSLPTHEWKIAITHQATRNGGACEASCSGVCQVKIDMVDPDHGYAGVVDGTTEYLRSSESGPVQILAAQGDTGVVWAIVRFASAPPKWVWAKSIAGAEIGNGWNTITLTLCDKDGTVPAGDPVTIDAELWNQGDQIRVAVEAGDVFGLRLDGSTYYVEHAPHIGIYYSSAP